MGQAKSEDPAGSAVSDDKEQGKIYRGNLLELSRFLTTFRQYYSWNNEELEDGDLGFAITPVHIENALTYRFLLQCKADLLDQKSFLEEGDKGGKAVYTAGNAGRLLRMEDFLADVESQLGELLQNKQNHQRNKHVNNILERFEVWSAKDLAHTLLMPPCGCHDQKAASSVCWSKLMHIPGACYFSERVPHLKCKGGSTAGAVSSLIEEEMESRQGQQQQLSNIDFSAGKTPKESGTTLFSQLYHQAHIQPASHSMCSLILPPNHYTSEEYARISEMVSHLPEDFREVAANSPCCGATKTMQNIPPYPTSPGHSPTSAKKNNIYAPEYEFQAHDLVALWVRAQRSSAAMRHLIQIFSRPNEAELAEINREKQANESTSPPTALAHQIVFRGNHRSTKRRILAETKQVQDLVAWAVMNQVLFHHQYMKKHLAESASQQITKKRPMASTEQTNKAKKTRTEASPTKVKVEPNNQDQVDDEKLLQACYSYLLRLFGENHHPLIAVLYFAKQTSFPSPAARMYDEEEALGFYEQCKQCGIPDAVQGRLLKYEQEGGFGASGATLARIDRRLRQGKYDSGNGLHSRQSPFYLTLSHLLRAWSEVVTEEESIKIDPAVLQAVGSDFDRIYEQFHCVLSEKGTLAAAKSLLDFDHCIGTDLDECSTAPMSRLLLGTSAPWLESCGTCGKVAKKHPSQTSRFTTCANCERSFHEDCRKPSDFCTVKRRDFLPKHAKTSPLFAVELPESEFLPEWRREGGERIQWTELRVTLRRNVSEDQQTFDSAQMGIKMTELSRDAMDQCLSGSLKVDTLFRQNFVEEYPLGLDDDVNGALVTRATTNGAGQIAGLQPNDVIIALRHVKFAQGIQPSCTKKVHRFANLDKQSRLELLRVWATEVELTILRPDKNLISQCSKWIKDLMAHNVFKWNLLTDDSTIPVCDLCVQSGKDVSTEEESEADRIKRDALNCRAVVRRLGRQSYSSAFQFESDDHATAPNDCVSLARLDAMMTYIVKVNSNSNNQPETLGRLRNAFYVPPWVSRDRDRLPWAPESIEKQPRDLLFSGMGKLVKKHRVVSTRHTGMPTRQQEERAFVRHFLDLFGAWCVPTPEVPLKVPPRSALCASSPFSETCSVCKVRAGTMSRESLPLCNSRSCLRTLNDKLSNDDCLANYLECAKLIGTTLLVFPSDKWLAHVAQREGLKIDSFGRPVEFIVTFYAPPLGDAEGEFFLHPVLSECQLQYLLDRCLLLQKPPSSLSRASLEQWIEGTVLGLNGVLRVSKADLSVKIMETARFFEGVRATIESCAKLNIRPSRGPHSVSNKKGQNSKGALYTSSAKSPLGVASPATTKRFLWTRVNACAQMMDSMVRLPTPIMQLMMDAWDTSRSDAAGIVFDPPPEFHSWTASLDTASLGRSISSGGSGAELNLTRDNLCKPKPPAGSHLLVLYTDLYFSSEEEEMDLSRALDRHLHVPIEFTGSFPSRERTIVLNRSEEVLDSTFPPYRGVGWGFELIRWQHESFLRVGRVHPRSPAAASGLQSHDVILSINGRPVGQGYSWTSPLLICSILASPLLVGRAKQKEDIMLNALRTIGRHGPVKGPVILKVHRSRFPAPMTSPLVRTQSTNDRAAAMGTLSRKAPPQAQTNQPLSIANGHVQSSVNHALDPGRRGSKDVALQRAASENVQPPGNNLATMDATDPLLLLPSQNAAPSSAGAPSAAFNSEVSGNSWDNKAGYTQPMSSAPSPDAAITVHNRLEGDRRQPSIDPNRSDAHPRGPQAQHRGQVGRASFAAGNTQSGTGNQQMHARTVEEAAITAINSCLPNLKRYVPITLSNRQPLRVRHLYMALGMNTVVTKVEAAVLLEAILQEYPHMGVRLLCPRYSLQTLAQQVKQLELQGRDLVRVPRLPDGVFNELLVKDYARWENENKDTPKMFRDKAGSFGLPTAKLPIDRTTEEILRDLVSKKNRAEQEATDQQQVQQQQQQQQQQQPRQPQQQQHQNPSDLEPIRWDAPSGSERGQQQGPFYGPPGPGRGPPPQPYGYYPPSHHPHMRPPSHGFVPGQQQPHGAYGQNGENPAERIRGGGPEVGPEVGPPLLGTHLASWHGQVVSFEAETTREETSRGAALFLGRVQLPQELQNGEDALIADIDEIDVSCFYASSVGVFDTPRHATVDPGDLFLITEGSKHFDLLGRIDRQYAPLSRPSKRQEPKTHATVNVGEATQKTPAIASESHNDGDTSMELPNDQGNSLGTGNRGPGADLSSQSQGNPASANMNSEVDAAAKSFVLQHFRRADGFREPLGNLPDGRLVNWFENDPHVLYVQETTNSGSEVFLDKLFRATVSLSNRERKPNEKICLNVDAHCCLWGCTFEAKDRNSPLRLAEFQSREMLERHNAKFHSYDTGLNESQSFLLGEKDCFIRVSDPPTIKRLVSGVTASVCALSAELHAEARTDSLVTPILDPCGQKIVCSPSRYNCSLSIHALLATARSGDQRGDRNDKAKMLHQLVQLVLKLKLLFPLSPGAIQGLNEGRKAQETEVRALGGYQIPCTDPAFQTKGPEDGLLCSLCALTSEAVILGDKNSGTLDTDPGTLVQHPQGIGCAIPHSILFYQAETATTTYGDLGFAKMMLLQIAKHVPSQMYSVSGRNDPIGSLRKQVWRQFDQGFDRFVRECSSAQALAQALIVLLAGVDHAKLPLWWRQGWEEGQRLLLSPSKSSLCLHLLVFDIALSEYIETGSREMPYKTLTVTGSLQRVTNRFDELSTERRIQLLLESAADNSISRYHGKHDYVCCVCDDGGTLLCCDFCPSTVHASCCSPAVGDLARWVCAACTVDIIELVS